MSDLPPGLDPRNFRDSREHRGRPTPTESPEDRVVQLKFARAQLAAQIPTDEGFAALQAATVEMQALQLAANEKAREDAQARLVAMDEAIADLEAGTE